jgi:hypothetical protein
MFPNFPGDNQTRMINFKLNLKQLIAGILFRGNVGTQTDVMLDMENLILNPCSKFHSCMETENLQQAFL